MADMLRTGLDWLAGQMITHASREVIYRRGNLTVTVSASVGQTLMKLGQDGQLWMQWTDRDYLIRTEDLVFNEQQAYPEKGDIIEDTVAGKRYEVLSPTGESPWRFSDPQGLLLRIHTKDVGAL